jgi:hypothetical protein
MAASEVKVNFGAKSEGKALTRTRWSDNPEYKVGFPDKVMRLRKRDLNPCFHPGKDE